MATIPEMITFIASQSLNDDTPDIAMQTRILTYINRAYQRAYDRLSQHLDNTAHTTQNVTVTTGVGTLSPDPLAVINVVDVTNGQVLEPKSIRFIEEIDPKLEATGSPAFYYLQDTTTINVYPPGSTSLRVRYVPQPVTLTLTSPVTDIKIPAIYHNIIEQGALAFVGEDEKDFDRSTVARAEAKFKRALDAAAQRLSTNAVTQIKTPFVDF